VINFSVWEDVEALGGLPRLCFFAAVSATHRPSLIPLLALIHGVNYPISETVSVSRIAAALGGGLLSEDQLNNQRIQPQCDASTYEFEVRGQSVISESAGCAPPSAAYANIRANPNTESADRRLERLSCQVSISHCLVDPLALLLTAPAANAKTMAPRAACRFHRSTSEYSGHFRPKAGKAARLRSSLVVSQDESGDPARGTADVLRLYPAWMSRNRCQCLAVPSVEFNQRLIATSSGSGGMDVRYMRLVFGRFYGIKSTLHGDIDPSSIRGLARALGSECR